MLHEARLRTLRRAFAESADAECGRFFSSRAICSRTIKSTPGRLRPFTICSRNSQPCADLYNPGEPRSLHRPSFDWGRRLILHPSSARPGVPDSRGGGSRQRLASRQPSHPKADPPRRSNSEIGGSGPGRTCGRNQGGCRSRLASHQRAVIRRTIFRVALDAATRLALDYLALSHWHSTLALDGGRMVMAGDPGADGFLRGCKAGCIHLKSRSPQAGQPPQVTPIRVAEWQWRTFSQDLDRSSQESCASCTSHRFGCQGLPATGPLG